MGKNEIKNCKTLINNEKIEEYLIEYWQRNIKSKI